MLNATSVIVTWDPLECNNSNGNIIGYIIEYISANGSHRGEKMINDLSCILTNLIPLMEYSFTVTAVNANGTGPPGQALAIVIGITRWYISDSLFEYIFLEVSHANDSNNGAIIVAVSIVAVFLLVAVTVAIVLAILYTYR